MAVDYSKWHASDEEIASHDTAPFDFEGARKRMVARVERTIKQLKGEKVSPQGGKDFETRYSNGVVYRPTYNGQRIKLPGEREEHGGFRATREKLAGLLDEFKEAIGLGHHDTDLEAASKGVGGAAPAKRAATSSAVGKVTRGSGLPARADGLPHRVPVGETRPNDTYTMNKAQTHWRSPEQVAADEDRSSRRQASIAAKKG